MEPAQVFVALIGWALVVTAGYHVGKSKGRQSAGLVLTILLGLVGLLILAFLPKTPAVKAAEAQQRYQLPYPPPYPSPPSPYPPQSPYPPAPHSPPPAPVPPAGPVPAPAASPVGSAPLITRRTRLRHLRTSLTGTRPATASAAVGLGLGLLALGPGLRRGFLLSYDMLFVPREPFPAALPGLAPPRAVPSDLAVATLSRVLPADILQKLILLAIFTLACSGAAALLDREPLLARLAAGVFYTWNPYVAERLIIGHWALLLGYAAVPWVLRAVLAADLYSRSGAARLVLAVLPAVVGGFAALAITALVAIPAAVCTRNARRASLVLAVLALGSLPWFIPSLLHQVYVDPASVAAFAARADTPFGSIGSLLMLGGAWNAQTVPQAYGGPWSALWLAAVIVALTAYLLLARPRHRWPGLGVAAVIGLGIAALG